MCVVNILCFYRLLLDKKVIILIWDKGLHISFYKIFAAFTHFLDRNNMKTDLDAR